MIGAVVAVVTVLVIETRNQTKCGGGVHYAPNPPRPTGPS